MFLWHEILHAYFGQTDLDHAAIQFITDEELRVKLNGGSYPPYVGHASLSPLMNRVLPQWKRYLNNKDKNIKDFMERMGREMKRRD